MTARYGHARSGSLSASAWDSERANQARRMTASDLAEELADASAQILSARNAGRPDLYALIVDAVIDAALDRWTDRAMGVESKSEYAADVAALVMLKAAAAPMLIEIRV